MLFSKPALLLLCVFLKHRGTVEEVVREDWQGRWEYLLPRAVAEIVRSSCISAEAAFCPSPAPHCLPVLPSLTV